MEVKLWSPKSGSGELDQLKRYLQIADDLSGLNAKTPADCETVVVYLTPKDTTAEFQKPTMHTRACPKTEPDSFSLDWQDLVDVINELLDEMDGRDGIILKEVRLFLQKRGLERFTGFHLAQRIRELNPDAVKLYNEHSAFRGFQLVDAFENMDHCGNWTNANE